MDPDGNWVPDGIGGYSDVLRDGYADYSSSVSANPYAADPYGGAPPEQALTEEAPEVPEGDDADALGFS